MKKLKRKYNTGVQRIYNDTPDNSNLYNYQAKQVSKQQATSGIIDGVAQPLTTLNPVAGTILSAGNKAGDAAEGLIGKNSDGSTKVGGFAANKAIKGGAVGASAALALGGPLGMFAAPFAAAGGAAIGGTYGLIKGKSIQNKEKQMMKQARDKVNLENAQKLYQEGSSTDAQSFLAKKGKYKVKPRIIESEGREPVFSPKKKDGSRDLLYFNPNDPTHANNGVKLAVVAKNKYKCGTKTMKYKQGTSSIKAVIPEGSSIVSAEKGANIKAIDAFKQGDFKTLDKIINSMPEDKSSKNDDGNKKVKSFPNPRFNTYTSMVEDGRKGEYKSTVKKRKYIQKNLGNSKAKINATLDKDGNVVYENPVIKGKMEIAAKNKYAGDYTKPLENYKAPVNTSKPSLNRVAVNSTNSPEVGANLKSIDQTTGKDLKKGFDGSNLLSSIPSIAEIAARQSLLNKGVDKVPENYVKFGKYKYASQLPKILRENTMDANNAKQSARNVSAGNVGNYLSNSSNIYGNKLKANNDAVVTDTLARQDILNKNVDVANNEEQINVGLKNQFNDMKAQNLGAYRNQIITQGQSVDSLLDSMKKESWAKKRDQQLLDVLKTRNYKYNEDSGISLNKKGNKKVRAYKTIKK